MRFLYEVTYKDRTIPASQTPPPCLSCQPGRAPAVLCAAVRGIVAGPAEPRPGRLCTVRLSRSAGETRPVPTRPTGRPTGRRAGQL